MVDKITRTSSVAWWKLFYIIISIYNINTYTRKIYNKYAY